LARARCRRWTIPFLWAIVVLWAAPPAQAAADGLRLEDAVQYALKHSPRVAKAEVGTVLADLNRQQVHARMLPSLDLTTSQGFSKTLPQGPPPVPPTFGQASLALTETLYDNGETLKQTEIAERNEDIARLSALKTRDDTVLDVTRAFYNLSQQDLLLTIKRQQLDLLTKQLRQVDVQFHQGLKTKKDFQRFQSQVQRATLDVMGAETAKRSAAIDLLRAMGAPEGDQQLTFRMLQPEDALALDPVIPAAVPPLSKSYVFRIAELQDQASNGLVEIARRRNLPVVTLGGGVTYQNPDYIGALGPAWVPDSVNWQVTLGITYNIWDNGTRRRDIDIATNNRISQDQDSRDSLVQLNADIRTLMATLGSLKATFLLNKQLMALEQETFNNLEVDYRQGKVAYLDLVTGFSDLLNAKVDFFSTYISILSSLAQYRYYEGTIYDSVAGS
jgi:outer membrane protein TolC